MLKKWQHSEECMCRLRTYNVAMRDYQESATDGQTEKVILMCRYASQATQIPMSETINVKVLYKWSSLNEKKTMPGMRSIKVLYNWSSLNA